MEIKAIASNPVFYATVASLAVLIIGAIAYQKIGLLNNCAPVTGIIMMSVGAGVLFFEGIIWSYRRIDCSNVDVQYFEPMGIEQYCTMEMTGESKPLTFEFIEQGQQPPSPENQKFCIWTQASKEDLNKFLLWVHYKINDGANFFIVGSFSNNKLTVSNSNQEDRVQFLKLIRKHHLNHQPHK